MQGVAGSSPAASTTFGFNNPLREPEKPLLISFLGFFMSEVISCDSLKSTLFSSTFGSTR
jgi:hypothetical protein